MSVIYKRLRESNIEDLLVEAGLIVEGLVVQALRGCHYNRAIRLYKLFYEPMLCIIISHSKKTIWYHPLFFYDFLKFIDNTGLNSEKRYLVFQSIMYDEDFSEYVKNLFKVQESNNHLAKNILSIMNVIEIQFMNIDSLLTKEWDNFLSSINLMMPWMMVYDNTIYSRWLPVFWMDISSLSQEHCQLK